MTYLKVVKFTIKMQIKLFYREHKVCHNKIRQGIGNVYNESVNTTQKGMFLRDYRCEGIKMQSRYKQLERVLKNSTSE